VLNPSSLFELSFQLSFLAVLGILYGVPKAMAYLPKSDPWLGMRKAGALQLWWRRALVAALTTLSASLATMPLVVMRFHLVPFLGIPANLLGVPLMGWLILPTALAGGLLYLIWANGGMAVLWVAAWMADWAVRLLLWAASVGGVLYLPSPRPWEIGAFYAICAGLCCLGKARWVRWATLGLALTLPALWGYEWAVKLRDQTLRVHFMAVGNGNSVLVEGPGGESFLLDGGGNLEGRPDVGAMLVAPVLWEKRIMSLNRVVLSHPHPDHMGGIPFILRAFRITDGIWDNGHRPNEPRYLEFLKTARALGWQPRALCSGETWSMGSVRVEVLHPPCSGLSLKSKSLASEANNRSVVLRLVMGEVSVLLPGDVEAEGERSLLERGGLASTALLAPHHGSRTSSTEAFLRKVMPRLAVFSAKAGQGGLVHPEIRERYKDLGVELFHTGEDGMVSLTTDGADLWVETYLTRRKHRIRLVHEGPTGSAGRPSRNFGESGGL